MKRSNRLIFLIGIILAIVAGVGVFLLISGDQPSGPIGADGGTPVPEVTVVTARSDIQTGTIVESSMLSTSKLPSTQVPFDAFTSTSQIVGLPARQVIVAGVPITATMFAQQGTITNAEILRNLEPGFRAMAVQVDQVTGVGTVVQPGDRVDIVIAFEDTDGKFPVVAEGPSSRSGTPPQTVRTFELIDDKINNTSVKVLVENSKILGTLLPPPPADTSGQPTPAATTATDEVALTGQQQIVILQLTPQQVELARFAQLDGNLSIVLRAVADGVESPPSPTTGITLFELVSNWGVLPGQMTVQVPPAGGQ